MKYGFTNDAEGKKLLELLSEQIDGVALASLKKQLKLGEIRVNGKKIFENISLGIGDEVTIFLPEKFVRPIDVDIVYSDENIIVCDKPINTDVENNLVRILSAEFGKVYPVHRLDRNTRGLVIFARDSESADILKEAIKSRKITKIYRALLLGKFNEKEFTAKAYLQKDGGNSKVKVFAEPRVGSLEILTHFKILSEAENFSEAEITLITGRTHQIRAHAAFLGHPVLGDGKYGIQQKSEFGFKCQQLEAVRIVFGGLKGKLSYLNGKVVSLKREKKQNIID